MEIDYSSSIFHIRQSGMQCWVRSSQMAFSWILNQLGFTKSNVIDIFYESMFPRHYFEKDTERLDRIRVFNQLGLGRKLRREEKVITTIDSFFIKIYQEFGASTFSPEIFASVMTNYLNELFKIQKCPPNCEKVEIIFDNDKKQEKFGNISYYQFRSRTNNLFNTGCFFGQDKEIWSKLSQKKKLDLVLLCLKNSPVLIEYPGHALLLSGYSSEKKAFIVNDSLNGSPKMVTESQLLKNLTTIVMFFKIQK
ncbi:MAG: hypothetical protein ACW981_09200 [Candidatus Hodarchaeales archaeon]|jgi:hypothetical protein